MTTRGFDTQVAKFFRKRRVWPRSLRPTGAKATGKSATGSVAMIGVKQPGWSSSTHGVPVNLSKTNRQ